MPFQVGDKVSFRLGSPTCESLDGSPCEVTVITWEEYALSSQTPTHTIGYYPIIDKTGNVFQIAETNLTLVKSAEEPDLLPEFKTGVEVSCASIQGTIDYKTFKERYPTPDDVAYGFAPINVDNVIVLVPKESVKLIEKPENPFEFIQVD